MKKIITDGIIFDVDGTIWDTTGVVEKAWNEALDICGLSYAHVKADTLKGLFGLPMLEIIAAILPNEKPEVWEKYKPICYEKEDEYLQREPGTVYSGMDEALKILSEKCPLYIVSNCQGGYIELMCEKTGFGKYFKDFTCPAYTDKLKADNIKIICDRNGIKNPLYVGDTQMDANACKEAGVPIVFASYGFGKIENPDYTIKNILELCEMI